MTMKKRKDLGLETIIGASSRIGKAYNLKMKLGSGGVRTNAGEAPGKRWIPRTPQMKTKLPAR